MQTEQKRHRKSYCLLQTTYLFVLRQELLQTPIAFLYLSFSHGFRRLTNKSLLNTQLLFEIELSIFLFCYLGAILETNRKTNMPRGVSHSKFRLRKKIKLLQHLKTNTRRRFRANKKRSLELVTGVVHPETTQPIQGGARIEPTIMHFYLPKNALNAISTCANAPRVFCGGT